MQAAFCSSTHFVLGVSCVQLLLLFGICVGFVPVPSMFLFSFGPSTLFSSEYGQELASCLKTLFSHTAGSSSVGVQPAAFRSTVSSGSLGKGRSCQYFIIKLGSFNGGPKPVEHFFERAEVQIGFFIMTETGPKTILAGFFLQK